MTYQNRYPATQGQHLDEFGKDTSYYVFKELYLCRVPYIQMLSVEEIEHFGMPSIGDAYYDYQMANELREIMIPIAKMVDYVDKGANLRVVKPADTKRIYDRITAHLLAWKDYLTKSLNVKDAPLEDLRKLDNFANVVYVHAKYHFTDTFVNDLLSQFRGSLTNEKLGLLQNMENVPVIDGKFQLPDPTKHTQEEIDKQYPARASMAEAFLPKRGTAALHLHYQKQNKDSNLPSLNNQPEKKNSLSDFLVKPSDYKTTWK